MFLFSCFITWLSLYTCPYLLALSHFFTTCNKFIQQYSSHSSKLETFPDFVWYSPQVTLFICRHLRATDGFQPIKYFSSITLPCLREWVEVSAANINDDDSLREAICTIFYVKHCVVNLQFPFLFMFIVFIISNFLFLKNIYFGDVHFLIISYPNWYQHIYLNFHLPAY